MRRLRLILGQVEGLFYGASRSGRRAAFGGGSDRDFHVGDVVLASRCLRPLGHLAWLLRRLLQLSRSLLRVLRRHFLRAKIKGRESGEERNWKKTKNRNKFNNLICVKINCKILEKFSNDWMCVMSSLTKTFKKLKFKNKSKLAL